MHKDDDNNEPAWLKRMQNGSIGEARTKALLMDRFWILERSVDVDGADLLIQRRLLQAHLLDKSPEKYGVVQVKFYSSKSTTQYVKKEYVHNSKGEARGDFIVIAHTGYDDNPRAYYLLAEELENSFEIVVKEGKEYYKLQGADVLSDKYEIKSRKAFLDRIEKAIGHVNFIENRRFAAWNVYEPIEASESIDPKFHEPIHNYYCDIPNVFADLKTEAVNTKIYVEEILSLINNLIKESDPIKYAELIGDIAYECRDGRGKWRISLSEKMYDEEFENVCKYHIRIYEQLKSDGLLDVYSLNKNKLYEKISKYLNENDWTADDVHIVNIKLERDCFTISTITSEKCSAVDFFNVNPEKNQWGYQTIPAHEKYEWINNQNIEYAWLPGRCSYKDGKCIADEDVALSNELSIYRELQMKITSHKYDDEEEW